MMNAVLAIFSSCAIVCCDLDANKARVVIGDNHKIQHGVQYAILRCHRVLKTNKQTGLTYQRLQSPWPLSRVKCETESMARQYFGTDQCFNVSYLSKKAANTHESCLKQVLTDRLGNGVCSVHQSRHRVLSTYLPLATRERHSSVFSAVN